MKPETYDKIVEKAKTRKNGVYSFDGHFYLVVDGHLAGWSSWTNDIYECSYGFNVSKGKAKDKFDARDVLKGYLKQMVK